MGAQRNMEQKRANSTGMVPCDVEKEDGLFPSLSSRREAGGEKE